jgi:hypothetical protein
MTIQVRPMAESAFRYARNSVRAYLDDERRSLTWIVGVLQASGVPHELARLMGLQSRQFKLDFNDIVIS